MGLDLKRKYLGSMVGSALGDAIGELAFAVPRREDLARLVDRMEKLVYTDDTAMMIGLADSIVQKKAIDPENLGETFCRNFYREPWRGYAAGPPTIFSLVRSTGLSYVEAAKTLFGGSGSLGNGAAMRIAPVGLYFHDSEHLYEAAAASAEVTHAHPVGKDGAAILAWAVAQALKLDPEGPFPLEAWVQGLISSARTPEIKEKMEILRDLLEEEASPSFAADTLGRSVEVDESMPFALYSFLKYPHCFEDCLFCAILNGGDRDTLGAMAGAVSGAYLGIDAIPEIWRNKLENLSLIENLALSLLEG